MAPLEEFTGSEEDREDHLFKLLQELPAEKKALIVRNSHMGGHRFAGNCIVGILVSVNAYSISSIFVDIYTTGLRHMVWSCLPP
jgi:hypothetical protein